MTGKMGVLLTLFFLVLGGTGSAMVSSGSNTLEDLDENWATFSFDSGKVLYTAKTRISNCWETFFSINPMK